MRYDSQGTRSSTRSWKIASAYEKYCHPLLDWRKTTIAMEKKDHWF